MIERMASAALACAATASLLALGAGPAAADPCGVNLATDTVQFALDAQPEAFAGVPWDRTPSNLEGNFDPCATLSVALATVEGATGSSPTAAMLFNRSTYVGSATGTPRGFTSLNLEQTTNDTVALNYKSPGSCNACYDGTTTTVRFQWQERGRGLTGRVVQMDALPPG